MRRLLITSLVLACALALPACGDDDEKGTAKSAGDATTTTKEASTATTDATDAEPADADALVDALVTSALSDPEAPVELTDEDARCLAEGIVDTFGPEAFADAGLTPSELEDPDSNLEELDSTPEQDNELGAALQDCEIGRLLAPLFLSEFGGDEAATKCLSDKMDLDERSQGFLADAILNRDPDEESAANLVGVLIECIDIGRFAVEASGLELTTEETTCVSTELEGSEAFLAGLAGSFSGDDSNSEASEAAILDALTTCLTAARLIEVGLDADTTTTP